MTNKQALITRVVAEYLNQFRIDNGAEHYIYPEDVGSALSRYANGISFTKVDMIRWFREVTTIRTVCDFDYKDIDPAYKEKIQALVVQCNKDTCLGLREAKHLADWACANWA